ncbi:farnesyl-diphosphate synthase [Thioclava sp. SK-1]|uniref:polyprenyl synthetase family protein n=1 Tax=Thioclava sp. SK-1 TaxID=1889770 RepID=UPI0008267BEF|nr:farnesyl diphosphate synthase [Thioclava sp. SK-1]OCX65807.1 farnesyl-diphosphate synthase [Thioclava sp. SK-1]
MFQDRLAEVQAAVQDALNTQIARYPDSQLRDAMGYAAQGGKRLRALLVLETAALFDIDPKAALTVAAAVEALHAYSLVHDDMPCMDDDDMRRGLPTVHIQWDEATATLAGDALQTMAFELLTADAIGPATRPLVRALAQASGAAGMVYGQALDIAAETAAQPLSLDDITALQNGKTGALITFAATAGAILADEDTAPLETYAHAIGLAFQIADDILDVEGSEEATGKRLNKDADAGKATFVSHLGIDGAKARAEQLVADALEALLPYGDRADRLRDVARFIIARKS